MPGDFKVFCAALSEFKKANINKISCSQGALQKTQQTLRTYMYK